MNYKSLGEQSDVVILELFPCKDDGTVDLVAFDASENVIGQVGYFCSEGSLHLVPCPELAQYGFMVDNEGYVNVNYDFVEDGETN